MKIFHYKALNEKGEVVEDVIQAGSEGEAITTIKASKMQLLTISSSKGFGSGALRSRISVAEKSSFCRFMATMLRSGMSLPEAIDIIRSETKNKRLKKILGDISFQTQKGNSLSTVLGQYQEDFGDVFLTLVKVGEESGTLEKSFDYLSKQLSSSHELTQKVKGSMMYPAVIVVAMIANGLLMMLFVLPRISKVFLKLDVPLPFYTRWLLMVGNFFGENIFLILGATVLAGMLVVVLLTLNKTRNIIFSRISKLPLIRSITEQVDIARFASTLSTLLKSGVPIVEALDVSSQTLSRAKMRREAEKFSEEISRGESLSSVLAKKRDLFPAVVMQTIRAGEQSGSLEVVLAEMAEFYEKEVDYSLKRFTALLEPILMLTIGVVVGVMVLMMIAPIYSIIGGLQQVISK